MQAHDEERDIYGAVYVQGKKYFLLEPRPFREREWWMQDVNKWLVADEESAEINGKKEDGSWNTVYFASYLVIGSDAVIDLVPVPVVKKVIRFYVTDDEEA